MENHLLHNTIHIYMKVSPILCSGVYSQIGMLRTVALREQDIYKAVWGQSRHNGKQWEFFSSFSNAHLTQQRRGCKNVRHAFETDLGN